MAVEESKPPGPTTVAELKCVASAECDRGLGAAHFVSSTQCNVVCGHVAPDLDGRRFFGAYLDVSGFSDSFFVHM